MQVPENKYVADFFEQAHKSSSCHKHEIMSGKLCGCFYCQQTFLPTDIVDWIEEDFGKGETAICPRCGIDSVLSSNFPIADLNFLKEMNRRWF